MDTLGITHGNAPSSSLIFFDGLILNANEREFTESLNRPHSPYSKSYSRMVHGFCDVSKLVSR